jgi:hypothetical protein
MTALGLHLLITIIGLACILEWETKDPENARLATPQNATGEFAPAATKLPGSDRADSSDRSSIEPR